MIKNLFGIISGVIMIVMSIVIFSYGTNAKIPEMEEINYTKIDSPSYESNEYYGGDAYTGIQQAAAQAANNIIPVFSAVNQGNNAVQILNKNLAEQAKTEAENMNAVMALVKFCFGSVLLSFGLVTIAKNIKSGDK